MMYLALKSLSGELVWYQGAQHMPGFADLMVEQIREFKQSGETPESLTKTADEQPEGALRQKLSDIAAIWRAYEKTLAGRYADADDELAAALARAHKAPFLEGADVWVHGFETVTATLGGTLVAPRRLLPQRDFDAGA